MTKEAARYLEVAKDDDRTTEEIRESLRARNERVEWPIREMVPEVFEEDDEQHKQAHADD